MSGPSNNHPAARSDGEKRSKEEIHELALTAYQLRLDGLTYTQIGREMRQNTNTVYVWIQNLIKESSRDAADQLVAIEDARLDMLTLHARDLMNHQNPDVRLKANAQLLRISESRRKLHGADAAERVEVVHEKSEAEIELEKLIREQRRKNGEAEREMKSDD